MTIEDVRRRTKAFEFADFSGGVGPSIIDETKNALQLPISPEYRGFLTHLGSGSVESEEFIGLGGKQHLDVVRVHADLLQRSRPLPQHLIPIRGDGFGNYDCIDTSAPTQNGEFAVVQCLHDGDIHRRPDCLASSYFAWFESILDMIRGKIS